MFSPYRWLAFFWCAVALTDAAVIPVGGTCDYNGLQCPVYQVLSPPTEKYELRHYEPASWIATTETVAEYTPSVSRRMYFRLKNYFDGGNSNNQNLEMTVPVLTMRENTDVNGMYRYTKYFLLVDSNAPDPTGNGVYKYNRPAFRAYVRQYGGRPTFQEKLDELNKLTTSIGDSSLYRADRAYFAGYNPPWVRINRRNEVWVEAN
ncbi:heme-binding protein 2-like [Mizuhopecten yessoensis]|uniref:Heme-binding protein 2 n=1 Tax=Mizuhopecten yessoensis TaxID=6573 RepID=A0A210Q6Y8_MIZYE|nr:heme-binding protein 2-like [Mizuhopecten yessoensis]OWF44496.1 Heme-binding protein 2 [Mizuhopecten yessoensis]